MIAHELRGPVTTVKGLATTGARHYDRLGDPEKREFFELIDQESRRLLHIVDQTSLALKIDAGSLTYDIRPEDLAVAVADGVRKADAGDHAGAGRRSIPRVRVPLDRAPHLETVRQLVENAAQLLAARSADRGSLRARDGGQC